MLLKLEKPYSMGDVDDDYTHAKITSVNWQLVKASIRFTVMLGLFEEDKFVVGQGIKGLTRKVFDLERDDYADFVAKYKSAGNAPAADEFLKALYQWVNENGHFVGTVEA